MGVVKYIGPVASFHCPTNAEIRSLKVHFSPKQLGEGDPSPENVRPIEGWDGVSVKQSGKNLFDANAEFFKGGDNRYYSKIIPNAVLCNVSFKLKNSSIDLSKVFFGFALDSNNIELGYNWVMRSGNIQSNKTNKAPGNRLCTYMTFYPNTMETFESLTQAYDIQIELEAETPYESYQGFTTNYEFGVLGKNKLPIGTTTFTRYKQYDLETPLQPGVYTVSALINSNDTDESQSLILFDKAGKNDANVQVQLSRDVRTSKTLTLVNSCAKIYIYAAKSYASSAEDEATWTDVQLELGSTATAYEPYDPNHTVYGGWVDLISGEVCEEKTCITIDGTQTIQVRESYTNANAFRISKTQLPIVPIGYSEKDLSSFFQIALATDIVADQRKPWSFYINGGNQSIFFLFPKSYTSVTDVQNFFVEHPTQISYMIAPNTYHLAPTELQTFLGQNNVWSNADYVEVEYDLHETQDILNRKAFIMANQPHVVTPAAAPLQSFTTDLVAPLKECKVHFEPKQDLHGYDKPWVGGSGKNLFNINATEQNPSDTTSANTTLRIFTVGTYAVGTSWSNWWQPTQIISYSINNNILTIQNNNVYGIGFAFKLTPEATYTISATSTNGGINVSYYDANGNYITTTSSNILNTAFTVPAEADITLLTFFSRISSETATFTNIQLEAGSTATSYEPYENICPIEGWEKIQIGLPSEYTRVEYIGTGNGIPYIDTGIYLTDELETEIHYYNDKLEAYLFGARVSASVSPFCNFNIETSYNRSRFDYGNQKGNIDNTRYNDMHDGEFQFTFHNRIGTLTDLTLSTSKEVTYDRETCVFQPFTTHTLLLFAVYNSANSTILTSNASGDFNIYSAKFWIGGKLIRNFIPCIRKSDNKAGMYDTVSKSFFTSQNSSEFIPGEELEEHSLLIDWSNSTGTVYGGYVDLVKGELIQTCYNMIVDENTIINNSEDRHGVYRIVYNLPYTGADKNALMCNKFGLRLRNTAMYNYPTKGLIALGDHNTITTNLQIGAPDEEITTQEKWLNWLTVNGPIQVIYELAEPIHYSLTPTTLKTLRGQNNIWSSANGNIEIKYWKH